MSSITKCLNTSTICRKVARCDKKLCVVLIEADIFNKAVQGNIPKPLKNLYIKFDVNTLRHCGEMACVEEYLHTFGNSDITTLYLDAGKGDIGRPVQICAPFAPRKGFHS